MVVGGFRSFLVLVLTCYQMKAGENLVSNDHCVQIQIFI